jgi:hypothetical protein
VDTILEEHATSIFTGEVIWVRRPWVIKAGYKKDAQSDSWKGERII